MTEISDGKTLPPGENSIVPLPRKPRDEDLAYEYKSRLQAILQDLCDLFDEANAASFHLAYQTGSDSMGKAVVLSTTVARVYK